MPTPDTTVTASQISLTTLRLEGNGLCLPAALTSWSWYFLTKILGAKDCNTPAQVPATPKAPQAVIEGSSLSLRWDASSSDSVITDYDMQYRRGTSGEWTDHAHSGAGITAQIGLADANASHHARVRATRRSGSLANLKTFAPRAGAGGDRGDRPARQSDVRTTRGCGPPVPRAAANGPRRGLRWPRPQPGRWRRERSKHSSGGCESRGTRQTTGPRSSATTCAAARTAAAHGRAARTDALAAVDVTIGCIPEGTLFCPERIVTRAEMAAFLSRARQHSGEQLLSAGLCKDWWRSAVRR